MMVVAAVRHYDDTGRISAHTMVMVMMVVVVILCQLDIFIRRGGRP